MQERAVVSDKQAKSVRNAMIFVFFCGTLNIIIACIEFSAFLPRVHWTAAYIDAIIDLVLSLLLLLAGWLIYKKNRWGWVSVTGLLGFLMINQFAIAPTVLSYTSNNFWYIVSILWAVAQGIFMAYLRFNKSIRSKISPGYLLQPPGKR